MTVRRSLAYLSCLLIGMILGGTLISQWMKPEPLPIPAGVSPAIQAAISHAEYAMVPDSPEFQQSYGELSHFLQTHLKR